MANTKNEPTNPVGHALPAEYLLRHFELDPRRGLDAGVVCSAQARHGPNALPEVPPKALCRTFVRQFKSPMLADSAAVHAGTAVTALVMTGLVIIGLLMRPQGRTLRVVSWVSVGLAATYVVNAALVYLGGV